MQVGIPSFGPRCGVAVFLLAILSSVCVAQGLDGAGLDSEARTPAEVALEPADAASRLRVPLVVTTRPFFTEEGFVAHVPLEIVISTVGDITGGVVIATGTSDAQGRARFELPWSPILDARLAPPVTRLLVRVRGSGWQSTHRSAWLPLAEDPIEMFVVAREGVTVRGRVLDADGVGVVGSITAQEGRLEQGQGPRSTARTRPDGSFDVQLSKAGTFAFFAETEIGVALAPSVEIDFAKEPPFVELHLRGDGRIRGTVRDDFGAPAAGLNVMVLAAELDQGEDEPNTFDARKGPMHFEGLGSISESRTTAIDGAFDVRGLRPGNYVVRVRPEGRAYRTPWMRVTNLVVADGVPIDIVYSRPHLVVRVVDTNGVIIPHGVRPGTKAGYYGDERWPHSSGVYVAPSRRALDVLGLERENTGHFLSSGEWVFEVEDGREYDVQAAGGELTWAMRRVDVPVGASRVEVEIVRAANETGRLRVAAVDVHGAPIRGGVALDVQDVDSGITLARIEREYDAETAFRVPAGTWRVVVEGRAQVGSQHGELITARRWGRSEQIVRVEAGRETSVVATLAFGARLRVQLTGEVSDADLAAMLAAFPHSKGETEDWQRERSRRVFLVLRSDARTPIEVCFRKEDRMPRWTTQSLTTMLELGSAQESEVLPAGEFTLEARLPGGRIVTKPVVLVDGQTTDVTIEF